MTAAAKVRILAGAALAIGTATAVVTGWGDIPWWGPILLALAVAVAETAVVHLSFGRQRWTFSLT
jgi:hypothetical protein